MTQTQQEHFDEIAGEYDEALPAHVMNHYLAKRTTLIRSACPPPARVLDVGCGTGVLAASLVAAGYEVTGVDPSAGMLDFMGSRVPEAVAIEASGTELPFPDGVFDLSLTVAALHHIAEPAAVRETLVEMVRVVRPGGRILIWDHNPLNPYWPHLMKRVPQDQGDERLVPLEEILDGLADGGAAPLSVRRLGLVPDFTPPRLIGLAAAVERTAERIPIIRDRCAHNVVLAARNQG